MHHHTLQEFEQFIQHESAVLVYFSHEQCSVCKVLKPKVIELIKEDFPQLQFYYADIQKDPEIAAQNRVLTAPTIIGFVLGKETFRFSRNLSIDELQQKIERFYQHLFE